MLNAATDPRFHIDRENLTIAGLSRTYRFMQLSDSHLSPDSPLDTDEVRAKAAHQREIWLAHGNRIDLEDDFRALAAVGRAEQVDLFLLAGDMTDFPSEGTAHEAKALFDRECGRYLYVPGNHEQGIRYPAWFAPLTGGDPAVQVTELDELTLVGIDNGMHDVTDEALSTLERVAKGDKPVILLHHIPIDCETLHPAAYTFWEDPTYFLFGMPGGGKNTARYIELVTREQTAIRAVIAGHMHYDHVDTFENGVPQYISAPVLGGYGRILTIQGE